MSGLQRSSSVRTNASSRSSSSRYRNLGGTIIHKVRLDDPALDPHSQSQQQHPQQHSSALGLDATAAAYAARKSFSTRMRLASGTPSASSHHSSPRQPPTPLTEGFDEPDEDARSDTSGEGSEDDYGEAESYPLGPGQVTTSSSAPMSSAHAYTQDTNSFPRRGSSPPPLPPDAFARAQQFSLERVPEQSPTEEDIPVKFQVSQPARLQKASAGSQATARRGTTPPGKRDSSPAEASQALASEIEKLAVLDAYANSASNSDVETANPSPAPTTLTLPDSSDGRSRVSGGTHASFRSALAGSDPTSPPSPRSFTTPLSTAPSLPRSESMESDDVPLGQRVGEDAATAIQKKLIQEDRERQIEETLRSMERGGRTGSAKEKRAAEAVKQQESHALVQAQAQIAAQQAQIQVLLQAQQQLLQHATAKQQQQDLGAAELPHTSASGAVTPTRTAGSGLGRTLSHSKSIHAARQAKAVAAANAAASAAAVLESQSSGLHRAKTHGGAAPHSSHATAANGLPATTLRTPRRADTIHPAPAASVGVSVTPVHGSGFAPGSDAELLMRAAAVRSPRAAAVATMGPSGSTVPAVAATVGGAGPGTGTTTLAAPGASANAGGGASARRPSHGASTLRELDTSLAGTANASAPVAAVGLTPAQEIAAAAKAGLGGAAMDGGLSTDTITPGHIAPTAGPPSSSTVAVAAPTSAIVAASTTALQQLRVYIVNKQRYGTVLIRPDARAREVTIETLEQENINVGGSEGGWVVWDVCPGMGIERPLREYEIISQVTSVRAHVGDDYFLLKRTELAPYLGLKAVPTVSPALAGYVYVEDRKKKWTKRWLELREHSLYHAKSEKGKDEVFICSLSTFDVYLVDTAKIKTPRAHAFAIRSQNSITMFEKPDQDYVHYFCLSDPVAHRSWVRAILNARTYVLKQEQAALFKVAPIETTTATTNAAVAAGQQQQQQIPLSPLLPSASAAGANGVSAASVPAQAIGAEAGGAGLGIGGGLTRQVSLSRSRSTNRRGGASGGAEAAIAAAGPSATSPPQTLMAQMLEGGAGKYANATPATGPAGAVATLARARTTSAHHSHSAHHAGVPHRSATTLIGSGAGGSGAAPPTTRDMLSGPFAKGSLLEGVAVSGAGRNGLGVEVSSSQAFMQAQALASSVQQAQKALQQQMLQQQQQQILLQQQQQAMLDFSTHESTRARMAEEARKRDMIARMRRAREEGRPLVEEAGMRR
ncbi:hypothetical protein V8E36_006127 [Tilletia maclaganii]